MKNDLNGWIILETLLCKKSENNIAPEDIFGHDFDLDAVANGEYLINAEEIAALMDAFELDVERRCELLKLIIKNRYQAGVFQDVANLRQLLCAAMTDVESEIPCVDIEKLSGFNCRESGLAQFISKLNCNTVKLTILPTAQAFRVDSEEVAQNLEIPRGSLIIVDPENSPCPDELSVSQDLDGNLEIGCFNAENSENLSWSFPILRLHLLAGNSSGLSR